MAQEKKKSEKPLPKKGTNFVSAEKVLKHPVLKRIGLVLSIFIVGLFLLVFSFNIAYSQVIYPNSYIGGINVSGKTLAEAQRIIEDNAAAVADRQVTLSYQDQKIDLTSKDIDLAYDPAQSAESAWSIGRAGAFNKIVSEEIKSLISRNDLPAVFTYNSAVLQDKIAGLAKTIDNPEQETTIVITDLAPAVVLGKSGTELDQTKIQETIQEDLGNFMTNPQISLNMAPANPKVNVSAAADALERTNKILAHSIAVKAKKKDYALDPKDIAGWLQFVPSQNQFTRSWSLVVQVDPAKINTFLDTVSADVNQPAQNAKFAVAGGKVDTFQIAQTGYELDRTQATKIISDAILNSQDKIDLPVAVTEPEIKDTASTNGIKELVAEGVTSWRGSPKNRIHNLTLGSQNISGTIVEPGQEFSTIKAIGPIDAEHGFLQELVIKNGTQVVPDVGGGLCQVSTTLFRAVLNSGLKVTARTNHSFRVSYYEPPVGMDATIYDPLPDFKFINDMKTPILIWATSTDTGLSFQIYGTKDDRVVDISTPVVGDYVSPPAAVYIESANMEPGAIRQTEHATRGATASFKYNVTAKNGDILEDQTFVSKYIPIPDSFLYGPGTQIPPQG